MSPMRGAPRPGSAAPVHRTLTVLAEEDLFGVRSGSWGWQALPRRWKGRSRDRLDDLGERWFETQMRSRLSPEGVERIRRAREDGGEIHLESAALDHVMRPLARHLGATRFSARRLEFRDGRATGRVLPGVHEFDFTQQSVQLPAVLVSGRKADPAKPFSVRGALAGRHVLLVGGSGFIGKVWMASLLRDLPEIGRLTLLVRSRNETSSVERFERIERESPVLEALRAEGVPVADLLREKVAVVDGDVTRPGLGLSPEDAEQLRGRVDLIVSCAGLTEFNPDLRDALDVNVDGTLHVLEFARECRDTALLHVSTCYVSGRREGRIPERIAPHETPSGRTDFDAEAEWRDLQGLVEEAVRRGGTVRRALIEAGSRRARALGWPNIYTFTKALGESLLALRAGTVPYAIVRPAIVESALEFPFPGWNEGINTSCPLSHLLGTAFRQLPVNDRKCLDVIPVDAVTRGMTLIAAALAERRHDLVYQMATSAVNPLDLARAVELTALAHGNHYREIGGWRERILARLEAVPVSRERYERFSVPRQLRIAQRLNRALGSGVPGKKKLVRAERLLRRIRELIELYEPFLLDQEPVFEVDRIEALSASLPPDEHDAFGWDVRGIDWYDYWIRVHIPGLRRWSYPLIDGKEASRRGRTGAAKEPKDVPGEQGARGTPEPATSIREGASTAASDPS